MGQYKKASAVILDVVVFDEIIVRTIGQPNTCVARVDQPRGGDKIIRRVTVLMA